MMNYLSRSRAFLVFKMIENPKTVYIETYGCSNNLAESQIMAGLLEKSGFVLVDEEKNADIVIVNTCGVKDKTENKIIYRLSSFRDTYPGKKLIVAGCLPEADKDRVRNAAPQSVIVSTNNINKIAIAADFALQDEIVEFVGVSREEKVNVPKIRSNEAVDIVPISSGCISSCTFCSTKLAKGDLFSYKEDSIVEEIRSAKIGGGAKEFWLTSQDCGCYGFENGTNIAKLISRILSSVPGKYFLRLGMANPQHLKRFLPELVEVYKDGHLFKFLHVPVQSGSNNLLRKMARGHTAEDFVFIINEFRKQIPEITVWTDMIIGFPTETDEDFELSMSLLREIKPDVVNMSSFSPRPGTLAAKLKQLPTEIKKERTRKMGKLAKAIYSERNRQWLGWKGPVLVDEYRKKNQNWVGRNYAYKPVVIKNKDLKLGQIIDVEIIDCSHTHLLGIPAKQ